MSRAARGRVSPGTDERRASIDDARRDFAKSPAGKTLGLRAVALQSPSETHLRSLPVASCNTCWRDIVR